MAAPAGGLAPAPLTLRPFEGGLHAGQHLAGIVFVGDRWAQAAELAGHEADVRALAPLPGGGIASGSEDGTVRVWNASDPDGVVVGRHADFVTGLCLLADGTLASASYDGTVGLWDLR